jgi:hypothetical protein
MRWKLVAILVATVAVSASPLRAQYTSKLTINGYSGFEFEKQIDEEGNGDPNGSFDADLFDLVLNFQVTDAIRFRATSPGSMGRRPKTTSETWRSSTPSWSMRSATF